MRVTESEQIQASPEVLYDLVADVSQMGQWSPEATGAIGASRDLQVGDTFVGTNRRGLIRWYTQCTVLRADRGRIFEFDVDFGFQGISRWTYVFLARDGGTVVSETWVDRRDGVLGPLVRLGGQLVIPGNRAIHNRKNARITLSRLKRVAEAGSP
ncbi:MAG: SRPBCC family protein [Actinomycetia bacterium]|nr:SRPBCC family protein [Actinomycetes bacterium]